MGGWLWCERHGKREGRGWLYLTEVTSQWRATAARQIREPRKPLPPKTTILFVVDIVGWFYDACMLMSLVTHVSLSLRYAKVFRLLILRGKVQGNCQLKMPEFPIFSIFTNNVKPKGD